MNPSWSLGSHSQSFMGPGCHFVGRANGGMVCGPLGKKFASLGCSAVNGHPRRAKHRQDTKQLAKLALQAEDAGKPEPTNVDSDRI